MKANSDTSATYHSYQRHDSAHKHVTGLAEYIDDITMPEGTLHAYLGLSERAHAEITRLDLEKVRRAPGVVDVLTASDIPGHNDVSPTGLHDEPIFAEKTVEFHGQPMFAVIAETRDLARRAVPLAEIDYADLPHLVDVADALAADAPPRYRPIEAGAG